MNFKKRQLQVLRDKPFWHYMPDGPFKWVGDPIFGFWPMFGRMPRRGVRRGFFILLQMAAKYVNDRTYKVLSWTRRL